MKRLLPILFFLTFLIMEMPVNATHNRAGEITLKQLDDYTYEILITTFTYTLSQADRSSLEVSWGDNTISFAPRLNITRLPNFYQKNVYITQHTFPGPGTYEIVVQDPNRNLGVMNIPNSVNVVFSVKTTISINPAIGVNSTPVLLNPPIDRAALNQLFIHNPAAYDPDGDSISYKLTICTEEDGKPIANYEFPDATDTLFINPVTGDLNWKNPKFKGIYNIAIDIEEWRNGVKIGNIVRDMQIEVFETENNPPVIDTIQHYCVEAGSDIAFRIKANDINDDSIELSATGGPFVVNQKPAVFSVDLSAAGPGHSEADFLWETNCSHVREQFYNVVIKAEDNNQETRLVDLLNVNIRVLGPPPESPVLIPASNSISVRWKQDPCPYVTGYRLYRKKGPSGYTPDSCVTGVPAYTGYEPIALLTSRNDTIYSDDNKGAGLDQGSEYCYIVTSIYPDGALSLPSGESCTQLVAGVPALLQTSVTKHGTSGEIELRWAAARDLDTIPATGPYEYIITRYSGLFDLNEQEVYSKLTPDITDTIFTDLNLNTSIFPYSYTVQLFNAAPPGNRFSITDPEKLERASSFYPQLKGTDNQIELRFVKNVPWINYDYTIFRQNEGTGQFDSIGYSTDPVFTDRGLKNGKEYCYKVISTGWRSIDGNLYENENISHINCTSPVDSIPPCTPVLSGKSFCDDFYNLLTWRFANDTCLEDVEGYKLYYSPTQDGIPELIEEYKSERTDTSYIDLRTEETLTGCYSISAIDSFANESPLSVKVCLDECSNYILPNVFSPNNDKTNDLFIPLKTAFVEKVDFQVFNRWGLLVFKTDDPDLNWDGKILGTDTVVSPGVYYYICEVFEPRLGGLESYTLTGFIHVFSGDKNEVIID